MDKSGKETEREGQKSNGPDQQRPRQPNVPKTPGSALPQALDKGEGFVNVSGFVSWRFKSDERSFIYSKKIVMVPKGGLCSVSRGPFDTMMSSFPSPFRSAMARPDQPV
jgi:hypothetical protein